MDTAESTAADELHLTAAIAVAHEARAAGNHPFGALVVVNGAVIVRAQNAVVTTGDATAHAELNALRMLAAAEPGLAARATLYASTEPCPMCSGAIYWAGIRRVVYGCPTEALARLAGDSLVVPCRDIFARAASPVVVVGPLLEAAALAAHAGFWR